MTGKIKLVHSGGNAVSIAVPTSNPSSSEVEFKLPQADGSADTFLKTDGSGNLSFGAAGITMTDQWRITSSATGNQAPIQNNLERVDLAGYGVLGNGMSVSSGIWTFPATGIYRIDFQLHGSINNSNIAYLTHNIQTTINNSAYSIASHASPSAAGISATIQFMNGYCSYIFDVVDTSTHKVKFHIDMSNTAATTTGDTDVTYTGFFFTRLGDT